MDGRGIGTPGLERRIDLEDDHTRGLEIFRLDQNEFSQTHTYPMAPTTSVSNTSARCINKDDSSKRSVQSAQICGMRRSAFWRLAILAVLVVIIIAATVAGSLTA
jgi:anti-sigma-K factor RskA